MPSFAPVPEQLALLERGVVDFHVRAELEQRLDESRSERAPAARQGGLRPDAARSAPRARACCCRRCASSRTSGTPRSSSSATSRRWWATRRATTRAARGSRATRSTRSAETYLDAGLQGPRPREGRAPPQQRVARHDDDGRRRRAHGQVDRVADARAQGLSPALRRASGPSTSTSFSIRSCRRTTRSPSSATSSSAGPTSSST